MATAVICPSRSTQRHERERSDLPVLSDANPRHCSTARRSGGTATAGRVVRTLPSRSPIVQESPRAAKRCSGHEDREGIETIPALSAHRRNHPAWQRLWWDASLPVQSGDVRGRVPLQGMPVVHEIRSLEAYCTVLTSTPVRNTRGSTFSFRPAASIARPISSFVSICSSSVPLSTKKMHFVRSVISPLIATLAADRDSRHGRRRHRTNERRHPVPTCHSHDLTLAQLTGIRRCRDWI